MDKKFSILIHPVNRELLYLYEPGMRSKSIDIVKKVLEWMNPFKAADIEGIKSQYNAKQVKGELIMCPLLTEQMLSLSPKKVFSKVKKAAKLAEERGSSLLGLAAYTAMIGERGLKLKEYLNIPLTTGANLTLATIPEAILRVLREVGYNLEEVNFLIFGAGPIVLSVISKLGESARKIYIYSPRREILTKLKETIPAKLKNKVEFLGRNFKYILKWINFVIVATNKIPPDFNIDYFKKGTIIFDSSYPRKVQTQRKDILVIDGVSLKPPGEVRFNFNFGLPEGLCFPCMAEPIALFLEDRLESFSLGKDISLEKADEIFRLALKHGFQIGPFTNRDYLLKEESIVEFKNILYHKERRFFIIEKWLNLKRTKF